MTDSDIIGAFDEFLRAIDEFAHAEPGRIVADGKVHRFAIDRRDTKHSGWYILQELDHCAWGVAGSWKSGEKWEFRKYRGQLDPERKKLADADIAKARRSAERQQNRNAAAAAEKARKLVAEARETTDMRDHEWAWKKALKIPLPRLRNGAIVVPLRNAEGDIVSAQIIDPSGTRRFIRGSRVAGAWFAIGAREQPERILICEGVSTGDALHTATGEHVCCAMSASNLEPVSRALRKRHPGAEIVVCADNDARITGKRVTNPGLDNARKAATAVGGKVACPPEPGTDFHDMLAAHGPDVVRNVVDAAEPVAGNGGAKAEDRWNGLFRLNRFGQPLKDVENISRWIRIVIGDRLQWDNFMGEMIFDGNTENVPERLLAALFGTVPEVSWSPDQIQQGIEYALGTGAITRIDSLEKRLEEIVSSDNDEDPDHTDWIEEAVRDGITLEDDYDHELAVRILRTFMIGAVSRIMEPGCKFDYLLTIRGPQGIGKTTLARMLALDPAWFSDGISMHRLDDRDEMMQLAGVQIVELPEMVGLRRADIASVKRWITRTHDSYRPPYGRHVIIRPRRFVCVATTNEHNFLTENENRRYLIIRTRDIDVAWWAEHRDDVYRTAFRLWKNGVEPVLPDDARGALAEEHETATERDPWEDAVLSLAEQCAMFDTKTVLEKVGKPLGQAARIDEIRIGTIVCRLLPDWRKVRIREGAGRRWVWRRNDLLRRS